MAQPALDFFKKRAILIKAEPIEGTDAVPLPATDGFQFFEGSSSTEFDSVDRMIDKPHFVPSPLEGEGDSRGTRGGERGAGRAIVVSPDGMAVGEAPLSPGHAGARLSPSPSGGEGVVGRVFINADQFFDNVPEIAWNFQIGGYQPAQKWLKDRKGRALGFDDVRHYAKIIKILAETDRIMKEIVLPQG